MIGKKLQLLAMGVMMICGSRLAYANGSLFKVAATEGRLNEVQKLIREASQDDINEALVLAVTEGHLAIVQFLLGDVIDGKQLEKNRIADVNTGGGFPLLLAENPAIRQLLMSKGAKTYNPKFLEKT